MNAEFDFVLGGQLKDGDLFVQLSLPVILQREREVERDTHLDGATKCSHKVCMLASLNSKSQSDRSSQS